jgi:glycosyltransferase involved in cell wall biosynthesis
MPALKPENMTSTPYRLPDSIGGSRANKISVALLTGGIDKPYAVGLSAALASKGVKLDVIGGAELESSEIHAISKFLKLHEDRRRHVASPRRLFQHLVVYGRIICYAATAKPRIFHILWNYRVQLFDRTLLMLYYKLLGKKIVLTAHNVNAAERDGNESFSNRLSLTIQYRLVDHIFVHTDKMKLDLANQFGVNAKAITVIPFGVNNSVPNTDITPAEARQRLGVNSSEKVILFFGRIRPYKGLDYLISAFQKISVQEKSYRLIVAGEPPKESLQYWQAIQQTIEQGGIGQQIIREIRFIADEETEIYFKVADVLVLPYTHVFQSGVLFLAYSFGLPVIATDVGSLRDDIVEGKTGYVCPPCDATALARCLETYFDSELFKTLDHRRADIRAFARARNSWGAVGDKTCNVYSQMLDRRSRGEHHGNS